MSLNQAPTGPGVSCQSRHTIMSLNQGPQARGSPVNHKDEFGIRLCTKPRFIRCRIVSCLCLYSRLTVREAGISHIYEDIQSCHENIQSCHEDIQSCHPIKAPQARGSPVNHKDEFGIRLCTKPKFIQCRIVSCLCLYSRLTVREAGISHIYEDIQSCHENIQSCHEDIQSCHSIKPPQGSPVNL